MSASASHAKLEGFDLIQTDYRQVENHGIRADILVPRTPHTGDRPVILRFHGGGLIMGDSLFMDFYSYWLSDLALLHGAVIISPNYRLLPESTSLEIFSDIDNFWAWLHSDTLQDLLAAHTTPTRVNLSRILSLGESAGGLLGLSLALAHPADIRAAVVAYPMIDLGSTDYSTPREILPFGHDFPESAIQEMLSAIVPGAVQTAVTTQPRLAAMLATLQRGRFLKFYERAMEEELSPRREVRYPMERLEQVDARIPRGGIAIIHGGQDSVVPVVGSERFVARAREVFKDQPGGDKVILTIRDGDHGFDGELRWKDELWLQDTFKGAIETWLE